MNYHKFKAVNYYKSKQDYENVNHESDWDKYINQALDSDADINFINSAADNEPDIYNCSQCAVKFAFRNKLF